LSGALLARLTNRTDGKLSLKERTLAGFVAAGFPDLDYALFLLDPLGYLNWHRGPTHSLLLLPLWALLLAVILARLREGRYPWQAFYGVCALGIGVHILGDIITLFGTKVLWPLSDTPLALGIVFDVDPYIALIVTLGFIGAVYWRPQRARGLVLAALTVYLSLQSFMYWRTVALGEAYSNAQGLDSTQVYALPQPLSPFTWKLIVAQNDCYFVTYLNYLAQRTSSPLDRGFPWSLIAAYRALDDLIWRQYRRFGAGDEIQVIAQRVWQQGRFAAFRKFAVLPALYRVDWEENGEVCAWFTDLRYNFPTMPPTFRYGMCHARQEGDWQLYRLRYFRADDRQLL
jgi:inner membrane protein